MASADQHNFDRRTSDVNVEALGLRVTALEGRVTSVEHELRAAHSEIQANTALTEDIHGKNAAMYEAFTTAQNAIRVITAIGDGIMWAADKAARLAKPLFWIILSCAAAASLYTTGRLPDWVLKLLA